MYECEILADSIGPSGKRLTTLVVTYPRFVHSELLTHRMFSRNSASSRAIPNEKLRERVTNDPAMPVWWGRNQSGMQAREELTGSARTAAEVLWLEARDEAMKVSNALAAVGLHKQLCNRLIEPWMGITVIISATEWNNFFKLRCHPDAQPEIRAAAEAMREAMTKSTPSGLMSGEYHLPLVRAEDWNNEPEEHHVKLSVARCARVSYLTHDGRRDPKADFDLYERLKTSGHWSPFEHAARALETPDRIGNFVGWHQHRAEVDPSFVS